MTHFHTWGASGSRSYVDAWANASDHDLEIAKSSVSSGIYGVDFLPHKCRARSTQVQCARLNAIPDVLTIATAETFQHPCLQIRVELEIICVATL